MCQLVKFGVVFKLCPFFLVIRNGVFSLLRRSPVQIPPFAHPCYGRCYENRKNQRRRRFLIALSLSYTEQFFICFSSISGYGRSLFLLEYVRCAILQQRLVTLSSEDSDGKQIRLLQKFRDGIIARYAMRMVRSVNARWSSDP